MGSFGTTVHGSNSNCSRRNPQPLVLRRDCVTYSDGTNYADTSHLPPSPYALPPLHPSSSSGGSSGGSSTPSFTTAFSTSAFAVSLLSTQTMGTVVLPDLVILTNEIPWSSVASEFSVLTAEDITFDYFGTCVTQIIEIVRNCLIMYYIYLFVFSVWLIIHSFVRFSCVINVW